ncbi:condensation domain-containing protein [Zymobacter sp. IVIA_12111.31 C1]|uniref:condensation domain-containing protein n=1 Tax=Zymobacter sp. IVIA_12111.31 C1 TaxID=3394854 RepID=UPI0039C02A83
MPADLDADTFAAALRLWINRHDTLRSMLVPLDAPMANSHLQRFTLDPGTVDIEHVTVDTAAAIARHEPLSTVIEYLFDEQVGPCRWPGYLLLTISHSRATTVCLAVDHSLIDGYGLLKLPRELHMLYAVAQGTQASLPPVESYPDFAEAERCEAEALTASDETVQRWRRCLEAFGGTLPPFPINVHHPDTTAPPQRGGYLELLDDATTRAFTQQCRTAGGDIFSGLFACLAKAARELTGNPAFHTMAPFQTQPSQWSSSLGWYVGMAPVTFPLGEEETFETAIAHATQGLQALKTLALVPITRVAELLGQPLRDTFMVSFMDLRRVPGAREWEKWRVVSFRSRSNDPDEVCLWFMRTHNGLIVDYRHPATAAADRVVADYITRTKRQLNAIASTAKWYAPSS